MKYTSVVLAVSDIVRARKFYEDLFALQVYTDFGINVAFTCGIALQQDFDWLIDVSKDKIMKKTNNIELCFEEEDFDGFLDKLKKVSNIAYLGDVKEHSWGQRVIRFYDLDSHLIEVGEQMKSVVQRFLKANLTMAEISKKMDIPLEDIEKLWNE